MLSVNYDNQEYDGAIEGDALGVTAGLEHFSYKVRYAECSCFLLNKN